MAADNVEVICSECGEYFSTYANTVQLLHGEVCSECIHCGIVSDNQIVGGDE